MSSKAYMLGETVEVRSRLLSDPSVWEIASIISTFPMIVQTASGNELHVRIGETIIKRPPETKLHKSRDLPIEVEHEIFKKALVKIIQTGDTKLPNGTVRAMVALAKEAIGEM